MYFVPSFKTFKAYFFPPTKSILSMTGSTCTSSVLIDLFRGTGVCEGHRNCSEMSCLPGKSWDKGCWIILWLLFWFSHSFGSAPAKGICFHGVLRSLQQMASHNILCLLAKKVIRSSPEAEFRVPVKPRYLSGLVNSWGLWSGPKCLSSKGGELVN